MKELWKINRFSFTQIFSVILAFALTSFVAFGQTPNNSAITQDEKQRAEQIQKDKLALANRYIDNGLTLLKQETVEAKRSALENFLEARKLFKQFDEKNSEALTLKILGRVSDNLNEKVKALEYFEQALSLFKSVSNQKEIASTLGNMGVVYFAIGEKQKAIDFYNQDLEILQTVNDKAAEATTLHNVAFAYESLGNTQKALEYFQKSLVLFRNLNDKNAQAYVLKSISRIYVSLGDYRNALESISLASTLYRELNNKVETTETLASVGVIFLKLGENQKALQSFKEALSIVREIKDKEGEAVILNLIGTVQSNLGQIEKATESFNQALLLYNPKNYAGKALALNNIARIQAYLGEFAKALETHNEALVLQKSINDKNAEAETLYSIGVIYGTLGEKTKALNYYNQALPLMKNNGNKAGEFVVLNGIGDIFIQFGKSEKALEYFKQAFSFFQSVGNKSQEATLLNNIGYAYYKLGQKNKALENYNLALPLIRIVGDKAGEAGVLNNIGKVYFELGDKTKALQFYNQALQLARAVSSKAGEVWTLDNLMLLWNAQGNRSLAIIYGKQSVNLYEQARSNIQTLDKDTRHEFLKYIEETYRHLAEIFIAEGRLPEAQAILDLLKGKEYEQLRRSGETANTIPYSQTEADIIAKIENLVALERERTELQKLLSTNGELSAEQNNKLAKLNLDIAAANKAFDIALDALGKAEASATTRVDEIKGGKVLQSALTELGEKTNSGVVALYTVLGTEGEKDAGGKPIKDKLKSKFGWVIMVTENRYTAYSIDVTNLEETVFQFRVALSSPTYNPQPLAEKIYNAIFRQTSPKLKKTLEQDLQDYLKSHRDKTLMWSLDGVLRYIPMAALHDGKQYLVENYRNTVFTKESFIWLMNEYRADWKALGLGVSEERPNFTALPGVKTELETIVREPNKQTGILNGSIKLNDNFKKQTFFNVLNGGAFPVVHISSHYSFNSGKPENSFLLAGDGNLTFAEIKAQQNLFKKVDLLTLSACDTGVSGNGKEAEGFAYLAQSLGAKSVIASLWKVSDAGTPELMIRFYKLRAENPSLSKGEAFRRAQIALLGAGIAKKNSDVPRSEIVSMNGRKIELPLFVKDEKNPFGHPHYWSSFVLIGNWR
ncbi:MAG: tetratricopeptide repeat protein [Acidobacteriota bacterium]|nr:tetratricopeptide repeat protein [Acidobacteriota bacterium]